MESIRYDWRGDDIDRAILIDAALEENDSIIEVFLNHGASVDLKNKDGDTALILAAAHGRLDAVKLLLDHGANAHAMNKVGKTALSLVTQNGNSEYISYCSSVYPSQTIPQWALRASNRPRW